jgi:hypothetical protein
MESQAITVLPSGQRVRLAPGRHASPGDGACVVELASLLADEPFGDRPRCVDPVIGAFLRGWNDRAAYADRQRLRPYAERIVGSRASPAITRQRRDICLEWAGANLYRGRALRALARLRMRVRIAAFCGLPEAFRLGEGAGEYAARVLFGRRDVEGAFVLLDAMLSLGDEPAEGSAPAPPVVAAMNGRSSNDRVNGRANCRPPAARDQVPLDESASGGNGSGGNGNGAGRRDGVASSPDPTRTTRPR